MQSENSVAFKVFVSAQDGDKPEVRRFFIDRGVVTNFEYLKAKLLSVFPSIKDSLFVVSWKDDEQDEIIISTDEELILALSSMQDDLKKLYVKKNEPIMQNDVPAMEFPFTFAAPATSAERAFDPQRQHVGVVCDSCEGPVKGYRYKCVTCDDYDLCMTCEGNNSHSEHFMIRIPVPVGPLGGRFTKVVGHQLFKSLRRARAFDERAENGDGECIFASKRYRKEKASGDEANPEGRHGRHQRGHEGRGHHSGRHEGHPGRHEGRPGRHCGRSAGWLDTFSAYINEFANLAGDLNPGAQNNATPAAAANANPSTSQTASQAASAPPAATNINEGNAPNGNAPANGHVPLNANTPVNSNAPTSGDIPNDFDLGDLRVQYLQNVGRTIARILDPLGIDVDIDVRSKSNGNENESKETRSSASATSSNVSQDGRNIPARESVEKDAPIIDLDDSSSSDESLSGDTRKPEGWTMLNTDEPVKETSQSASANPINVQHIGFDLERMTQEFKRQLELQSQSFTSNEAAASSSASAHTGIYPLIPQVIPTAPKDTTSTPMEVVVEPPKQPTPPIVQAPPKAPSPPAPARMVYRLSSPRIAEAFERMLAMGFKDDNGRLARLLEAKDGNISAVLDVLSQNIP